MSDLVHARVVERLKRLRLGHVAERLDAMLSAASKSEPTDLAFLDEILDEEVASKQRKRVQMGIQIAHFPATKHLEDFDFKFQPSVDPKLVNELATGRFVSLAENVPLFGPPGVGKTHLAVGLGRAVVEAGHSVLFTTATSLTRWHGGWRRTAPRHSKRTSGYNRDLSWIKTHILNDSEVAGLPLEHLNRGSHRAASAIQSGPLELPASTPPSGKQTDLLDIAPSSRGDAQLSCSPHAQIPSPQVSVTSKR